MRKIFTLIILVVLLISPLSGEAQGISSTKTTILQKKPKRQPGHNQDLNLEGHRMPSRPIICYIVFTAYHPTKLTYD